MTQDARTQDRDLMELELELDPLRFALEHSVESLEERLDLLESSETRDPVANASMSGKAAVADASSSDGGSGVAWSAWLPVSDRMDAIAGRVRANGIDVEAIDEEQFATALFPEVFDGEAARIWAATPFSTSRFGPAHALASSRRILADLRARTGHGPLPDSSTSELLVHDARIVQSLAPNIAERMRHAARLVAEDAIGVGAGRLDYRPGPQDRL